MIGFVTGDDSLCSRVTFPAASVKLMPHDTPKPAAADRRERTLDDLKMKNFSREHDDDRVLDYLARNRQKLIEAGLRRYDEITN
ncbi:hypothetical protein F1643_00735 [Azospirillum sp. INR13]|uniref:hypothetical protein n=1 Tax=Azospirillum sp. INR13 TaxID=2596919 RepID=UPI001891FEDC|nr:hypothetical protein [Azospirillum sp. INR13]MBF5093207.1 hypothetical protein [Azospirillum sp. INR13]